jgi:hypothetical protein
MKFAETLGQRSRQLQIESIYFLDADIPYREDGLVRANHLMLLIDTFSE